MPARQDEQESNGTNSGDAEFTLQYFSVMVPFMLVIWAFGAFLIKDSAEADKRYAEALQAAAQWRAECRAGGGQVVRHPYKSRLIYPTKKQKRDHPSGYVTRYKTYCVR